MSSAGNWSLDALIDQVGAVLVRFLAARLGSPEAAADVAQDAYVRMLSIEDPGRVRNPKGFLFRTAANLAIDRMRRSRLEQAIVDEFAGNRGAVWSFECGPCDWPDAGLDARERAREIESAMAELPSSCREAFFLHRFNGFSHREIAERLGVSTSMVEKHLTRALEHLRRQLDSEWR